MLKKLSLLFVLFAAVAAIAQGTGTPNAVVVPTSVCLITGSLTGNFNCASITGLVKLGAGGIPSAAAAADINGLFTSTDIIVPHVQVTLATPSSLTAACTAGQGWADGNYVYVCTASGTIKRAPLVRQAEYIVQGSGTAGALQTGDPPLGIMTNKTGTAWVPSAIYCWTNPTSGNATLNLARSDTTALVSTCTCGNAAIAACTIIGTPTIADGQWVVPTLTSVPTGAVELHILMVSQ